MGTAEHVKAKRLQPEQSFERKFKAAHTVHSYQWMDTSDCCKTGLYDYRRIPPMDCSGEEPLLSMLGGKVPIVIVEHSERSEDIYGTVTHNRARGTHLLEPMKAIVKELMNEGKTVDEIGKQLGMKPEEIFRLSDFSKEDFLNMMTKGVTGFSKAEYVTKI